VALLGVVPERARFAALAELPEAADPVLRLGALAVRVIEDAARLCEGLRLSNAEAARLEALAACLERWHGCPPPMLADQEAAAARLLFEAGRQTAQDLVLVRAAEAARSERRNWLAFHAVLARSAVPVLPLTGADLLKRGLPSGRLVGRVLKAFQALWIRAGFPQEPGALTRLIDEAMAQARRE
jgi:poly(A) polymerase